MTSNDSDSLGISIISTLKSSELPTILTEITEFGLDKILQDGILKELPIIKWMYAFTKTSFAIKDYFLIKKIVGFLTYFSQMDNDEREKILSKIANDPKYQQEIGEKLVFYLDRYDTKEKADFLAKIFSAYLLEEIDKETFLRLSRAIDRSYISDLDILLQYYSVNEHDLEFTKKVQKSKRDLYSSDLSDFYVITDKEYEESNLEHPQVYGFNPLAITFAKVILKDKFHDGRW